jgi:hypothetical protein
MDCKDLMIGDWVICNDLKMKVAAIGETVGFLDCNNQVYWAYEGFDRIDPIPLTGEILVKNGFEYAYNEVSKMQNKQLLVANIGGHYIEVRLDKKNVAIWYDYDENESGFYSDVLLELPRTVHKLQHLLRLVGVQKEIEL